MSPGPSDLLHNNGTNTMVLNTLERCGGLKCLVIITNYKKLDLKRDQGGNSMSTSAFNLTVTRERDMSLSIQANLLART